MDRSSGLLSTLFHTVRNSLRNALTDALRGFVSNAFPLDCLRRLHILMLTPKKSSPSSMWLIRVFSDDTRSPLLASHPLSNFIACWQDALLLSITTQLSAYLTIT